MEGLILVHPTKRSLAFDIFGDVDTIHKYFNENSGLGYTVRCKYVITTNRDDYVCSEDLEHDEGINKVILEYIFKLVEEGFKVKVVGRGME
jgi:hypothetical protein